MEIVKTNRHKELWRFDRIVDVLFCNQQVISDSNMQRNIFKKELLKKSLYTRFLRLLNLRMRSGI
jgi:hypothetical protein